MPNYLDIELPKNTRHNDSIQCSDYICTKATYEGHINPKKGAGNKRKFTNDVCTSKENNTSLNSNYQQEALNVLQGTKSVDSTRCNICLQEIGRGIKHPCLAKRNAVCENVVNIVHQLPEKQQEQILYSLLRDLTNKAENPNRKNNVNLQLTNVSGPAMKIALYPTHKKIEFSNEQFSNFQVNTGSSTNLMKKMADVVRRVVGRRSVSSNLAEHLSLKSTLLSDLYQHDVREFHVEGVKNTKEKRPVVFADAEAIVSKIIKLRNLIGDYHIKILADGGQGFFKMFLTLISQNYNLENENNTANEINENVDPESPTEKRCRYSGGAVTGRKAKLTSVNRLIILCLVPKIKETYENLELLFQLPKLNNIPFKFVADFKLILMVNGQQTATSMFPCPYCCISLRSLRSSNDERNENSVSNKKIDFLHLESRDLKTYWQLKNDFEAFCKAGKDKKVAPHFHSTINALLFEESDDLCVLEKCIVPERFFKDLSTIYFGTE
ncbi:uncharacterized protein LOC122505669 isoform X2 [Leptopilina heterotoma]|uniref:uncharacterized protein LOC122505669 isoform X2 n=1 Tax=Leptopilina heterotoma TaxID=63436 RepID=UPI001CA96BDF|nr:uncharacterized protein LOC122505669 isoform X2 [Leptopilina heterotoma]